MQSNESGQIESALNYMHTLPTSSLLPVLLTALGFRRDSLSLYKVELQGSRSLSSYFVFFQNYGETNMALRPPRR